MTRLVALVGPTATGKTALAIELAGLLDAEVVNADSMQLYRGMDVGTAKPTPAERRGVPHHVLDVWDVTARARHLKPATYLGDAAGPACTSAPSSTSSTVRAPTPPCGPGWRPSWPRTARRRSTRDCPRWTPMRPGESCRRTAAGWYGRSRWSS